MVEKRLTLTESWNATYIFLRALWESNPKKFAEKGIGLETFLAFVHCRFDFDYEWRRSYAAVFKKEWDLQELLSPEQLLLLVIEFVRRNAKKFHFDLTAVVNVLEGMMRCPKNYLVEEELWKGAIERALGGEQRRLYWEYSSSDWHKG